MSRHDDTRASWSGENDEFLVKPKARGETLGLRFQEGSLFDGSYADGRYSTVPPGIASLTPKSNVETPAERAGFFTRKLLEGGSSGDYDASDSSEDILPPPKEIKKQMSKRDRRSAGAETGDVISKLVDVDRRR
ncbi:hypothetical protein H257_13223 [Aphanomyces astaci]|uniref:Uncharacterized protein n=1 Tax=Aphanomyces astaci TaxID=112090 RepID=W4FXR7_APHAT|nr:hypothetical protein H257_13223 [Aphanomyces astaci]ETV71559.1 hypothetical protein H257_13223 [Aphanomyces astaci]|eukprot:XP_009838992.1 hypothetical protein H257_13223 [Aphanomyces astaci]